jgi:DNA-binding transcriptional regulator YiaG
VGVILCAYRLDYADRVYVILEEADVDQIVVEGGTRTTGKNPGRPPNASGSRAFMVVLVANEIARPVELARELVRYGLSLRKAHDILNRISEGACIPVELLSDDPEAVASELLGLGVAAHTIRIPDVDIKRLRDTQKLSQAEFASLYGLELDTLQNWEQGRNLPDRSTKVLMKIIERFPEEVFLALTDQDRALSRQGTRLHRRTARAAKAR